MILKTTHEADIHEPDDETLEKVVPQMFEVEDDNFIILEKKDAGDYIQARPDSEASFKIEYRDSEIKRHYEASLIPTATVIALFQQFNRGHQSYRDAIAWTDISSEFKWPNEHDAPKKRHYVYSIMCSLSLQETFTEDEVEPDMDGFETDREPKSEALQILTQELNEYLSQRYQVSDIELYADSENMIDVWEEDDPTQ